MGGPLLRESSNPRFGSKHLDRRAVKKPARTASAEGSNTTQVGFRSLCRARCLLQNEDCDDREVGDPIQNFQSDMCSRTESSSRAIQITRL